MLTVNDRPQWRTVVGGSARYVEKLVAPFRDRIMLWTRQRAEGKIDSMVFVPKTQESEFETLRAEDENPEGCGGTDPD